MIRTNGEPEGRGEFRMLGHSARMQPTNSPWYNGCAERCLAILDVASRAARIQANGFFRDLTLPTDWERLWSDAS